MVKWICLVLGYLVGTLNPAALISRLKHKSLRERGTGNLGATNTMLVFGKKLGALVLLLDLLKGFLAVRLVAWLVPTLPWLALATGLAAVVGHCFPFYMGFRGGKGLATFAGLVLAYEPLLFLFLLVSGVLLMLLVNYSFILPFYAAVFFTGFVIVREHSLLLSLLAGGVSLLIVLMHFGNFLKALRGEDRKIRDFVRKSLFSKGNTE